MLEALRSSSPLSNGDGEVDPAGTAAAGGGGELAVTATPQGLVEGTLCKLKIRIRKLTADAIWLEIEFILVESG